MTPATRTKALAIVAAYNPQVGYPDRWQDYAQITILRGDLWANVAAGRRLLVRENRARAGKLTARDVWALTPSSSDAYIAPELDLTVLPAGFLQPPAFDLAANDAVNYGAIGAGVAHEMTHAVDATGALVDADDATTDGGPTTTGASSTSAPSAWSTSTTLTSSSPDCTSRARGWRTRPSATRPACSSRSARSSSR